MAKLHHLTLKAAVSKYAPLHGEGKPEEEVKAEIAKDEKGFDQEAVNEIYAAIIGTPEGGKGDADKGENKEAVYIVVADFRDMADFAKVHSVGDNVSHFDADRLAHLVKIGVVEKQ